jgi:hypothetical protein
LDGDRFFEFGEAALAQDRADAERPADRGDGMKQMLVDDLAPAAHARPLERARWPQRRIRECVVEILVDNRRLGDDLAVVHQRRNLTVRVDGEKFARQVLALRQAQIVAFVGEPLLLQGRAHLDRGLRQSGVIELEHGHGSVFGSGFRSRRVAQVARYL